MIKKLSAVLLIGSLVFHEISNAEPVLKSENIHLQITSYMGDNPVFQRGDKLQFLISLDQAAYLYVIYQTASNELIQLVPNQKSGYQYYQADIFIPVPDEKSTFDFIVSEPFGQEKVFAFALDQAVDLSGKLLPNGLKRLNTTIQSIQQQLQASSRKYFAAANFRLLTQDNPGNSLK